MNIINIKFNSIYNIVISLNLIIVISTIIILFIIGIIFKKGELSIEGITFGSGTSSIRLKINKHSQELAYKLWIELSTRKIGITIDEENDVFIEVYNSWYDFFCEARELLKNLPYCSYKNNQELVKITNDVLNNGLRPHLTVWQAKFRKWYEFNSNNNLSPQEVQKKYPFYDELLIDLVEQNKKLIKYRDLLSDIAFK